MEELDKWVNLEKGRTKKEKTLQAIDAISNLVDYGTGLSRKASKRVAAIETDEGIAISWKKGSSLRHLLLVSDPNSQTGFSVLERGVDGVGRGGFPRGIIAKVDKLYEMLDAQVNGHPGREQTALRKLMSGGPIEQARVEYERSVERQVKRKKKKKRKKA